MKNESLRSNELPINIIRKCEQNLSLYSSFLPWSSDKNLYKVNMTSTLYNDLVQQTNTKSSQIADRSLIHISVYNLHISKVIKIER